MAFLHSDSKSAPYYSCAIKGVIIKPQESHLKTGDHNTDLTDCWEKSARSLLPCVPNMVGG